MLESVLRSVLLMFILSLVTLAAPPARADPTQVKPGKVVLPLSGLEIELPKVTRKDFTWNLASSYSVAGGSYDGRDVIDEKIGDKIEAGTWVMLGYFTAGDCKKVLAAQDLTDTWDAEVEFVGRKWAARGGMYKFDSDLGKVPSVSICGHREGHKDLLLQHFYVADRTIGRKAILAGLPKVAVIDQAARAWLADSWAPVVPLRQTEVRRRGDAAKSPFHLAKSGIDLTMPDDGYVWIHRKPAADDSTDWLDRMAPALPELTLELIRVPGSTCASVLNGITTARSNLPGPRNLPREWIAGPTLLVNSESERTVCRQVGSDAVVVGVFATPNKLPAATDFSPLGPLLEAIAVAAWAPQH
jgi:hypothetical protein